MKKNPFLLPQHNLNQACEELDHITKMLLRRDIMLTEANIKLEEKNRELESARQEFLRTSQYLTNLLAHSPDAIWVLDNEGRVTSFNRTAEELTGYRSGEVMGRPIDFIFQDAQRYRDLIKTLSVQGSYRNLRTRIHRRDEELSELLISVSLLREEGEKGRPIGSITMSKSITREIRLEKALCEANERLEEKVQQRTSDLEVLSQTLMIRNQVSTVASQSLELDTLLNNILRLVLELTAYNMGAISTFEARDMISVRAHANIPEKLLERMQRLEKGDRIIGKATDDETLQVAQINFTEINKTGECLVVAVPLRAKGKIQGVMSLFSSLEHEILEEEREMLLAIGVQAGWAIENAWLYKQVREDVVKLREVDRVKTDFIATISHELRTPLTSIIGFLRYAEIALKKHDQNKLSRYIKVAMENGQKLAHMIEDLLAMQKLESNTLRLCIEPVVLSELLEEITEDLGPLLQAKEQQLILELSEGLPPLPADREQLERVLTNLINNAVKFSEAAGTISIAVQYEAGPEQFVITVADTGIGMSQEIQDMIFERFYQAESMLTRRISGVGLGLTIAKQIVEMHGGSMRVESEKDKGSTFTIILPAGSSADRPADGGGRHES